MGNLSQLPWTGFPEEDGMAFGDNHGASQGGVYFKELVIACERQSFQVLCSCSAPLNDQRCVAGVKCDHFAASPHVYIMELSSQDLGGFFMVH